MNDLIENSFIKGLKAIPCPYHNYYFYTKEHLEEEQEQFKLGTVRGEVVSKTEEELFELYSHQELAEKPQQLQCVEVLNIQMQHII